MERYRNSVLFVVICLIIATPLQAQENQKTNQKSTSLVQFGLEAVKTDSSSDFMELPTTIMDKLVEHDALNTSDIQYFDKTYRVKAEFIFDSMQSFRVWYRSEKAKSLLNTFKEDFDELELGFNIIR